MIHLICLLEEPSAKEMLKGIFSSLSDEFVNVEYMIFEGKQDLNKRLLKRLRGWQTPQSVFLILRDQDAGNCKTIKRQLMDQAAEAGKAENTMVRIACHELESFYLGDLEAVQKGLQMKGLVQYQNKSKFRTPDNLVCPSDELVKLTQGRYQKVRGSRSIAPHLKIDGSNRSQSFNALITGLETLVDYAKKQFA